MTTAAAHTCKHCSTLFEPQEPDETFCCGECAFVFHHINENGLGQYYTLKGGKVTAPVKNAALQRRDYSWLADMTAHFQLRREANGHAPAASVA